MTSKREDKTKASELPTPPLDTERYRQDLEPLDVREYKRVEDKTKDLGYGPGTPAAHRDMLIDLKMGQELRLLATSHW